MKKNEDFILKVIFIIFIFSKRVLYFNPITKTQ